MSNAAPQESQSAENTAGSGSITAEPSTEWREQISATEEAEFKSYGELLKKWQVEAQASAKMARALHAKSLGSARAEFRVLDGIPEFARIGMFKEPRTFEAWVRFSNGRGVRMSDSKPDVRGFAVKVVGVDGRKLIHGLEEAQTQDFLAVNQRALATGTPHEFMTFLVAARNPLLLLPRLIFGLGFGKTMRMLKAASAGFGRKIPSLATDQYFSGAAIKFGRYAARYTFRPIARDADGAKMGAEADYLREELQRRLKDDAIRFDFLVQFYTDEANTPIEDASVEWKAPFIKLAELTIPQNDLSADKAKKDWDYVEALSFDPWHATEEFRPLGGMMRARKVGYGASVNARGPIDEPKGGEP